MHRFRQFFQNHKGMTLVELLIAVVLLGLIAAAISAVIIGSNSTYRATSIRADLSQRAHMALEVVASKTRDASIVERLIDGSWKVTIMKDGNGLAYVFSLYDGKLRMSTESSSTVITSDVSAFQITPFVSNATFAHRINIELERDGAVREASTVVSLRR